MWCVRTDLVQLDDVGFGTHFAQEGLGGFAVGAVGFGEDGCDIPPSVTRHRRDRHLLRGMFVRLGVSAHRLHCCR